PGTEVDWQGALPRRLPRFLPHRPPPPRRPRCDRHGDRADRSHHRRGVPPIRGHHRHRLRRRDAQPRTHAPPRSGTGDAVEMKGTQEAFGLPEGSKEALLMGLIGWLSWHGLDGTEPSLTGAAGPRIA